VVIDKKRKLEQEVERLKQHLVSVEESSNQEALLNEEKETELKKKLQVHFNIFSNVKFILFIIQRNHA